MRGYIPQYDLGSRLLYQGLASGELQWVGIADRTVGAFDDVVLGLFDRIEAYQVKTSKTPTGFSIQTLLLGSPAILDDMVASATKLWSEFGEKTVETIYACDDFPYDNDSIGESGL
jgi:hypothetical protein